MKGTKLLTGAAVVMAGALALTGCSGGSDSSGDGKVNMTLWQNSTTGPGQEFWKNAVAAFEKANPKVTIKVQSIQNEDLDGKLQTALNSGDAPDIFLQRGGGKMAAPIAHDIALFADLAGITQPTVARIESGLIQPTFERLLDLVRACGLDLDVRVVPLDEDAWTVARRGLELTPDERLDRAVAAVDLMREGRELREGNDG